MERSTRTSIQVAARVAVGLGAAALLTLPSGCYQHVVHTEGIGAEASHGRIDERREEGVVETFLFGKDDIER